MKKLHILLADDHVLFRKGIASLIDSREDMQVVGEASDGSETVRLAKQLKPDVILMDINMPIMDGLTAVKAIRDARPEINVVMLTVSDDDDDLFGAIKNGAKGYLLKNLQPKELFDMLEGIRRGEAAISGNMAVKILQEFQQPGDGDRPADKAVDELTQREIEVLNEVVKGFTNKEIAAALSIAENTVKIHLRNILEKLHVRNRIQAAVFAVREGLVEDDEA